MVAGTHQARIRPPAVAGTFYPDTPDVLAASVRDYLVAAEAEKPALQQVDPPPRAIVVPHAGYIYSGPVAARAYARIVAGHERYRRVLLLGPSHHVWFRGLALPVSEAFSTPLGLVALDVDLGRKLEALSFVTRNDAPHVNEHSLEVQLPFLQCTLGDCYTLTPLVVGDARPAEVAAVIEAAWELDTLVVISTDLSHYHDWATACRLDAATARAIEALEPESIGSEQACGFIPLNGLLSVARKQGGRIRRLDLRNSGDTAGPREQVVGYGAWRLD
jgi:AmmeMemoRadiSam system protein B